MAVDLLRSPSSVKRVRTVSLPADVSSLLLIAAGDEEAIRGRLKQPAAPRERCAKLRAFILNRFCFILMPIVTGCWGRDLTQALSNSAATWRY